MSPPGAVDPQIINNADPPEPLTVADVPARRAKTKVPTGVAANSESDMFKSAACFTKPKAKRFEHLLSAESKSRKGSSLKQAAKYLDKPGLISLGGGLPSCEYFPFESISIKIPTPPHFSEEETVKTGTVVTSAKYDIRNGKSDLDLEISLNYGQSNGAAPMMRFVTEHTEIVHNPPYSDWQCSLTAGSTSSWDMALRMFCERGDYILAEEYTFATALEAASALGVRAAAVKMDDQGMLPESLDEVMTNWDAAARGARKPHLLYIVPSGQNPTGTTHGPERRKEIYKVAQKHDIFIVEDEPYYFLQMQPYKGVDTPPDAPPASYEAFIKSLIPSYLSIDVDGRVLRLESFSKVISPGSRMGWIVGTAEIVERYTRHSEVSTQNPSGMSQIILFKLLDESWGHAGYFDWLINLRMEYTARRNTMLDACEKYLPKSIASWNPPAAGMFHWIKVDWKRHPGVREGKDHAAIENAIFKATIEEGALVSAGSWFVADSSIPQTDMFFRATYAAAPGDKIEEAIRRIGVALRSEFKLD
ncbi:aromatic amino acid aminotransferase [Paracoccidioides lutzii Pb01]|uniref:aromatic-amino-acid transaminase n=1 Tax=Paracoccidioides lutzii (strain ATCC MYA-826 / Pb01) TaxID=502779 RepID=C1H4Q3_PARBA|nr:aromatic amino acid aminotransferase [Paracoccidioides lutzii Pb01]EEH34697.1 aromatic amino acid aminotransferase [Paracoccidioides lutzii Pb01]